MTIAQPTDGASIARPLAGSTTESSVHAARPRQLVICCDGTNNTLTGRQTDTNVLQLFELLATSPDPAQLLYYDPGVGAPDSLPSLGVGDWLSRKWERLSGLASGRGVFDNIGKAYQFLVTHYEPGDQIYLFGFSRGAFTVRCVAGMINLFGLVRPAHTVMLPTLLRVYFSRVGTDGIERGPIESSAPRTREEVAAQIRESFTSPAGRNVPVQFVGVWDTVASVGLPPFSLRISSNATVRGKCFRHVRQALALDEHRWSFLPRVFSEDNFGDAQCPQSLIQLWFRGVHCDVGGGYPVDQNGLSALALDWMIDEARACGLRARIRPAPAMTPVCRIHDPLFALPLWTAAGMCVRDSRVALGNVGKGVPITAVGQPALLQQQPPESIWDLPRQPFVLVLLVLLTALIGWGLRTRWQAAGHGDPWQPLQLFANAIWVPDAAQQSLLALDLAALRHALQLGMLTVPLVTALLAIPLSRAFASAAGWRQPNSSRPWFSMLGGALPIAAVAAALAHGFGWLTLWRTSGAMQAVWLWLASLASWVSLAGLVGCLVLLLAGLKKGVR